MDFRDIIDSIRECGDLIEFTKEVDPKFELPAIIEKVQKTSNKAIMFLNIKGYKKFRVASNILGNYRRLAKIFNIDFDKQQIISKLSDRWGILNPINTSPMIKRKIHTKDLILKDLIPAIHHYEKDAGPYITGGIVIAKDPETSVQNLSYHRLQMLDNDELNLRITPGHHLSVYFDKVEKIGKPLEIAVLIGNSPSIMLAASSNIPLEWDEVQFASSLQCSPVKLIPCETVNLNVPIDTEIVIEGEILPGIRKPEGPFGDLLGNYTPIMDNHRIKVKAVTMKETPIHYTILPGNAEDIILLGVPIAVAIYKEVRKVIPTVKDVVCWPSLFNCIIQVDKIWEGQAKQAALAAFGTNMQWMKYCIVVDTDVDIYDVNDISWALASRCRPEKDIIIIPNIAGFQRDPYKIQWGRVIVDATIPWGLNNEFEKKRIPGVNSVDLEKYK